MVILSSATASGSSTPFTSKSNDQRIRCLNESCTVRTRSATQSSLCASLIEEVSITWSKRSAGYEKIWITCSSPLFACSGLRGRFRCIDGGNPPVGNSESSVSPTLIPWIHSSLRILADVAYQQVNVCRCPFKKPQLTVAAAGGVAAAYRRRRYNQRLSACRIRIEHAFSRLKHTWCCLKSAWNLPLSQLPRTFEACCLLCNWLARTRNLHSDDD